jgi:hypothetical protein
MCRALTCMIARIFDQVHDCLENYVGLENSTVTSTVEMFSYKIRHVRSVAAQFNGDWPFLANNRVMATQALVAEISGKYLCYYISSAACNNLMYQSLTPLRWREQWST